MIDEIYKIINDSENGIYFNEYDNNASYELAYYTSNLRENLLNWINIKENSKILYISSDLGIFSSFFSRHASHVDILEENIENIALLNKRCQNLNNIRIINQSLELFETAEAYDYIFVIDYIQCIAEKNITLEQFFLKIFSLINQNGKIFVNVDNKLGLRYFNGVFPKEENLFNTFHDNLSNFSYTKNDIVDLFNNLNIKKYKFYYPFPESSFPRTVFTDDILNNMEFGHHYSIIGSDRFKFFDELSMYYLFQKNHCVDIFSNNYLIEICKDSKFDDCIYAKNQYYIGKKYKVVTKINDSNGIRYVEKIPLTEEAQERLKHLYQKSLKMEDTAHFKYINYELTSTGNLQMIFVDNQSLSNQLHDILYRCLNNINISKQNLLNEISSIFSELYGAMKYDSELIEQKDIYTDDFKKYYGNDELNQNMYCLKPCTLDLHCDHLYKTSDGNYIVIDTDPIVFFNVPIKYLIWSVIESWVYTYIKNNTLAEKLITTANICKLININESEILVFDNWKKNHFSDSDGKSQISSFYGNVYRPNFLKYNALDNNGHLINSSTRRAHVENKECQNKYFTFDKKVPIIVYGAAAIGNALSNILNFYNFNLIGFIDKRYNELKEAHGLPVWSTETAPLTDDTVVIIGIKNVFEQEAISQSLIRSGFYNLLYKSKLMVEGKETNEDRQKIEYYYDYLINLKGKKLENHSIFSSITLPKTMGISQIKLEDNSLISKTEHQVLVNIPIMHLFTSQQHLNPTYPWAEQSIISLVPHTKLYEYLWTGGKDKTNLYINFCAYGAKGSNVSMTDGWKKNLISNRLIVLSEMKKSLENDMDFFHRNAPEGIYNYTYNYFNLNGGRHRAALFVYNNNYSMPIKINKKEYEYFLNKDIINQISEYLNNNPDYTFNNPISHPYLYNLRTKRPQYYQFVIKKILEIISEYDLNKYNKINFSNYRFGIYADDHGELKRLISKVHFTVNSIKKIDEVEKTLDLLFRFQENKKILNYDFYFYDFCYVSHIDEIFKILSSTLISHYKAIFILLEDNSNMIKNIKNNLNCDFYRISNTFFDDRKIVFGYLSIEELI